MAFEERARDIEKLAAILLETGTSVDELQPTAKTVTRAQHHDKARLRGVPFVGRGISGAIRGSDPLRAVLAKESRRR
jgi:hypothetical protein